MACKPFFMGIAFRRAGTFMGQLIEFDATSLAFDHEGGRLLMSEPGKGLHIWDGSIDEPRLIKPPGEAGKLLTAAEYQAYTGTESP